MNLYVISLAATAAGPLLYSAAERHPAVLRVTRWLVMGALTAVLLFVVLPDSLRTGGPFGLGFAAIGFLFPLVFERGLHRFETGAHLAALVLGLIGILLHALLDGIALSDPHGHDTTHLHAHAPGALPLAVLLHRFPEGLMIWWLAKRHFGVTWALTLLGANALVTLFGYTVGGDYVAQLNERAVAYFQALVAGALLHVVLHRPHKHDHAHAHAHVHAHDHAHDHAHEEAT